MYVCRGMFCNISFSQLLELVYCIIKKNKKTTEKQTVCLFQNSLRNHCIISQKPCCLRDLQGNESVWITSEK